MKDLHLTKVEGSPDRTQAVAGMAYFAGTGPAGTYCQVCVFHGYFRNKDEEKAGHNWMGCLKYKQQTGHNGPRVAGSRRSCKYFEVKPK